MTDFDHKRLAFLMLEKNMNGTELSRILGITKQAVSNWFSGKAAPERDTIVKLSNIFNVQTDYLLGTSDVKTVTKADRPATIALSRADNQYDDLPDEAQEEIENFIAYTRQKYKKQD